MKIVFFDSGVGGLTVLKEAIKLLPNEKYIYYADSDNAPYGTKTKEEVLRLTIDAVNSLVWDEIKALVVACNTATSIAIDSLRQKFDFPIVGMEPAVKLAVDQNKTKKILVLATPLTLKEKKFSSLVKRLDSEEIVDILPLQKLVEFAERYIFNDERVHNYLEDNFSDIDLDNYSSIVLGCTHFSFFKKQISAITNDRFEIIDGNLGTVNRLVALLGENIRKQNEFSFEAYISGKTVSDTGIFQRYLDYI